MKCFRVTVAKSHYFSLILEIMRQENDIDIY